MSIEHDRSQLPLDSETALHDAIEAARQATQSAQSAGVPEVTHEIRQPFGRQYTATETMHTGNPHNSPILEIEHGAEPADTRTQAHASFINTRDSYSAAIGVRGSGLGRVVYDVSDRDHPYDPWASDKSIPGVPKQVALGTVRRYEGDTGEILHERIITRPETAQRLITTIANQAVRRAEAAHSAQFAPERANPRSQFSR